MRYNACKKLDGLLIDAFNLITKVEQAALRAAHKNNLSISEYHMLESVGRGGEKGRTINEIASDLSVTSATVTVGINKLVEKRFVEKTKCDEDGRVVYVKLTREGKKFDAGHRLFHRNMVRAVSNVFDDSELDILNRCFESLNDYFKKTVSQLDSGGGVN